MAPETDKRGSRRAPCFTAVYISHPGDGAREGNRQGGGRTEIHRCRIPSPELNPLMLRSKFMKEGESKRGQKEMKENDGGKPEKQTEFKSEKSGIDRHEAEREAAGEEGIWNLCGGMKREKSKQLSM